MNRARKICCRSITKQIHRDHSCKLRPGLQRSVRPIVNTNPCVRFLSFLKGNGESRLFHIGLTVISLLLTLLLVWAGIRIEENRLETETAKMASSIAYEQLGWANGVLGSTYNELQDDSASRSSMYYFYLYIYPYQEIPIVPSLSLLEDSVTLAILNYNSRVNQLYRARDRVLAEVSTLPDSSPVVPIPNSYRLYYVSLLLFEQGAATLVSTLEQRYPSSDSYRVLFAASCLEDSQTRWAGIEDVLGDL